MKFLKRKALPRCDDNLKITFFQQSYLLPEEGDTEDGFIGGATAAKIESDAKNAPHCLAELEKGGRLYAYRLFFSIFFLL